MRYSKKLTQNLLKTCGIVTLDYTPSQIRHKLESLQEEAEKMVFGHIGVKRVDEDVIITSSEINYLVRIREINNEFMEEQTHYLKTQ
jgi:hypothetical protein|tara:strand:+ start:2912 stop:3172 length:261 start_codon:yes stop_codon:yes gene_type:complete